MIHSFRFLEEEDTEMELGRRSQGRAHMHYSPSSKEEDSCQALEALVAVDRVANWWEPEEVEAVCESEPTQSDANRSKCQFVGWYWMEGEDLHSPSMSSR